jgi:hypothetical protein
LFPEPVAGQVKLFGPCQSGGSVVFDSANPDTGRPSAELNATVMVWVAPGVTETVPATEGVACTASTGGVALVPVVSPTGPLLPPTLLTGGPEPEALRVANPLLTLDPDPASKLQPASSDSVHRLSTARRMIGITPTPWNVRTSSTIG